MSETRRGPWLIKSSRLAYTSPWVRLVEHEVVAPTGKDGRYAAVEMPKQSVGVLPIDEEGHVWLVGHHRFPTDHYSWELPAGGAEPGENPAEAALRELEEEAGVRAAHARELCRFHPTNGLSDELSICFLATGISPGVAAPDDGEQFEIKRMPFAQAFDMAWQGQIMHSITLMLIFRARIMASRGEIDGEIARHLFG
jgi:8-oxo-dGTP pyrophosphatase MutT (NUDIX family)